MNRLWRIVAALLAACALSFPVSAQTIAPDGPTLAKVRAELADLPLEWREGASCTGAVATLRGGREGPRP